jgi:hypothetical protein
MSSEDEGFKQDVSFNLAQHLAFSIGELLNTGLAARSRGEISAWYDNYKNIRLLINPKLKPEEKSRLDLIEKKIVQYKRAWVWWAYDEVESKEANAFVYWVERYVRFVMDCLQSIGFFPSKDDKTKLRF